MEIGFIGLGNVGAKLAQNLITNGFDLTVHDLDDDKVAKFCKRGARQAATPVELLSHCDFVITCLPSPAACAAVLEGENGLLKAMAPGKIWMEMSTTQESELRRLAHLVEATGGDAMECPVSGGCHRAATGNISIFAGGKRDVFERILPILTVLGRRVLHTGEIGTASKLKVMTNYLATVNLLSVCEALTTMKASGIDLAIAYQAMVISSGTSFVAETEGQVILNGSRDIEFTMDLVRKDIGLFQTLASQADVPLELSPLICRIFDDGIARYGERANSDEIIRRLEEATGLEITAPGFPPLMVDEEPPAMGKEVLIKQPA